MRWHLYVCVGGGDLDNNKHNAYQTLIQKWQTKGKMESELQLINYDTGSQVNFKKKIWCGLDDL